MSVPRRALLLLVAALLLGLLACADTARSPTKVSPTSAGEVDTKGDRIDGDTDGRRFVKAAGPGEKKKKKSKRPAPAEDLDINDLHLEVVALQVLADLQVKPPQLRALAGVAEKTAQKPGPRKVVKVTTKYRKTLAALRAALADQDDDLVEELMTALDGLREKEAPDFDEIEITDDARKHAPAMLKLLNARQIVGYVGGVSAFPDPGERLLDGLGQSRDLNGKNWRDFRDAVADDVSWLVAGLDTKAEQKVRERTLTLLNKSHRLTEKEHAAQKADLDKEAGAITGKIEALEVVRHYMERSLAELLSNPRLEAALAARRKKK